MQGDGKNIYITAGYSGQYTFKNQTVFATSGIASFNFEKDLTLSSIGSNSTGARPTISVFNPVDQSIMLLGIFYDEIAFANSRVVSKGSTDVVVAKYDKYHNVQWISAFGGPLQENPQGVCTDYFGNVYVVGETSSDEMVISNQKVSGFVNVFVLKFDTDGVFRGSFNPVTSDFKSTLPHSCAVDAKNNVYITVVGRDVNDSAESGGVFKLDVQLKLISFMKIANMEPRVARARAELKQILMCGFFSKSLDFNGTVQATSLNGNIHAVLLRLDESNLCASCPYYTVSTDYDSKACSYCSNPTVYSNGQCVICDPEYGVRISDRLCFPYFGVAIILGAIIAVMALLVGLIVACAICRVRTRKALPSELELSENLLSAKVKFDPKLFNINLKDLKIEEVIGGGATATVFKAKFKKETVALKLFVMPLMPDEESCASFMHEIEVLLYVCHFYLFFYIV